MVLCLEASVQNVYGIILIVSFADKILAKILPGDLFCFSTTS